LRLFNLFNFHSEQYPRTKGRTEACGVAYI